MKASHEYALGVSASEIARLRRQNEAVGDETRWLLDEVAVQPGWRVADIGCGPMGILEALSDRVGPTGSVVGIDVNEAMVVQARAVVAGAALANVEILHGDAAATGLPRASFDLVHERLVLINVPRPGEIVAEMVALARPGALVLLEDIDGLAWACDPPHPAWDRLYGAFCEVFRRRGCDPHLGRRLPRLLRDAGAVDIRHRASTRFHHPEHAWRHLLLQFAALTRAQSVGEGLVGAEEWDGLVGALTTHLDDPHTVVVAPIFIQAWARRAG